LKVPRFSPDELIDKTFVHTLDKEKSYRATIVRKIQDLDARNHANIKFLVELGDGAFDEILAYGTLSECIEDLEDEDLPSEKRSGLLLMSLNIKDPSESPTMTGKDLSITSSCYGTMVLKLMNHLK
jgi:hypothetical protein